MFQIVAVGCGRMVLASWVEQPPEASDFCFGRSQSILNHVRQSQSPKSIHVGMVPFKVNSYWIMSVKVKVKVNQHCFRYLKVNPYSGIGHIHCGCGILNCAILLTIFIFVQVAEWKCICCKLLLRFVCYLSYGICKTGFYTAGWLWKCQGGEKISFETLDVLVPTYFASLRSQVNTVLL